MEDTEDDEFERVVFDTDRGCTYTLNAFTTLSGSGDSAVDGPGRIVFDNAAADVFFSLF